MAPVSGYTVYSSCRNSNGQVVTLTMRYSGVSPYERTYCAPPECCGKQAMSEHPGDLSLPQRLQDEPTGSYDRVVNGVCTKYYKHGFPHTAENLACSEGC